MLEYSVIHLTNDSISLSIYQIYMITYITYIYAYVQLYPCNYNYLIIDFTTPGVQPFLCSAQIVLLPHKWLMANGQEL